MIPLGVLASRRPASGGVIEFVRTFNSGSSVTTVQGIGDPYPSRYVILAIGDHRSTSGGNAVVTVNGTGATRAYASTGVLYQYHHHDVSYVAVPNGDTATFNIQGVNTRLGHIYTCPGPVTHNPGQNSIGFSDTQSVSVTIPAGGFGIAIGTRNSGSSTPTWTGVASSTPNFLGTSSALVTTSGTVSVTFSSASSTSLSVAIFRPA